MSVTIQFDKLRELKFDIPTYRTLESSLGGIPMGRVINILGQVSLTATTMALWAGFKHEDPALRETDVRRFFEDYIDGGGKLGTVGKALNDAFFESGLLREDDTPTEAPDANIVDLDRPRHVKFGMKAARMLEDSMGMGIAGISGQIGDLGINALTLALCVGLKAEDKNLTVNLTVKMLDRYVQTGGSVRRLATVVQRAIDDSGIFRNDAIDLSEDLEGNAKPEPVTQ